VTQKASHSYILLMEIRPMVTIKGRCNDNDNENELPSSKRSLGGSVERDILNIQSSWERGS